MTKPVHNEHGYYTYASGGTQMFYFQFPDSPHAVARIAELGLVYISREDMNAILYPPLTTLQNKMNTFRNAHQSIVNIHEREYNKTKYFHGFGFGFVTLNIDKDVNLRFPHVNPIIHASSYPDDDDVIKLTIWRIACWVKFKEWVDEFNAGTLGTCTNSQYTTEITCENAGEIWTWNMLADFWIQANLPLVQDYFN